MTSRNAIRQTATVSALLVLCAGALAAGRAQSKPTVSDKSPIVTGISNPRLKSPITLWAKDASLSEVLKILSEKSGMNIVSGEGVYREKMTIILDKTPLDEAINILVRAAGLSYEIIGNCVLIAEPDKLKDDIGQMGYVVELKYAPAAEVAKMLADIAKNVKVDEGGNRLVCYTSPRVINEIEKIVKAIDHPHILVMLETRLIEVATDKLGDYGLDWGALSPIQSRVSYPAAPLTKAFKAGDWSRGGLDFNVVLSMLVSKGDARVLMNSKLTTTNNREATLHIGELVPYTVQSYNMSGSGGVNLQIQKEEVGVKMKVVPHVNDDNQVTLTLEPEVSSIVGWKGPNADIPLVRVRKTNTTVRVESGETVFLAGLLSEEETEEVRKLPVLGDIPVLGLIFQHRKTNVRKTNLIIEITPRIIFDSREANLGAMDPNAADSGLARAEPAPAGTAAHQKSSGAQPGSPAARPDSLARR